MLHTEDVELDRVYILPHILMLFSVSPSRHHPLRTHSTQPSITQPKPTPNRSSIPYLLTAFAASYTMGLPMAPRPPKAAIFHECQKSHVFTLFGLGSEPPPEHEVTRFSAPCPQCTPFYAPPYTVLSCPVCDRMMRRNVDGTFSCLTGSCYLSGGVVETGTEVCVQLWTNIRRHQTNAFTASDIEAAQTLLNMSRDRRDAL